MRKRGIHRTFDKLIYRKSPIIPSSIAVKQLNNRGYSARTVKYANGDKSLFIKKINPAKRTYSAPREINNWKLPKSNSPFLYQDLSDYQNNAYPNLQNKNSADRMETLRNTAYSNAKELRWLVIREKRSGNLLSIGLVPEPIARMHLDLLGFDVNRINALNKWKNQEENMIFGLSEPVGQQLIDLQNQNNLLSPTLAMDQIRGDFEGELEYIISPERAKFENSLSNERIEELIEITGKTPNPFMGEQNTEFFRLYSWLPESAMYLTLNESENIVNDAYSRITDGVNSTNEEDNELFGFVGIKMLGEEGLKNDIGLGINLQSKMNVQFYNDMKNLQKDRWIFGETKPYHEEAIGSVAEDYGISPDDYLRLEWENPQAYKNAVLSQLEIMYGRGDDPIEYFSKKWESN